MVCRNELDDLSASIQSCNEARLAEVTEQSGDANARASAAYERASKNEKETAAILKQAEQERADAAKSLEAAKGYESTIAQANERAANAELETERIRKQLADRTLSDEQVKAIGNKLKAFKGQPYTITAYWDSKESLGLANRIHPALRNIAEWSYSDEGTKSQMFGGVVGVQVWTHPDADNSTKEAATALIKALNDEGIEAEPRQQNPKNQKTNMIDISVGSKR